MFSLSVNDDIPVSSISESDNIVTIDSTASSSSGKAVGATSGTHLYRIVRTRRVADPVASETPLTLSALANTEYSGGVWKKSVTNNSWNAGVVSAETFSSEDVFAVSWEIDNVDNWQREMGGLATSNSVVSYTGLDHALYQVNSALYTFYYEKGKATLNEGIDHLNKTLAVGDRLGMRVSSGLVEFFILKSGIFYHMGSSAIKATGAKVFKMAFNRGKNSNGASSLTSAWYHTDTTLSNELITIEGPASDSLSEGDVEVLASIGLEVIPGSTYGKLYLKRIMSAAFYEGATPLPVEYTHEYRGYINQDIKQF